ncbi:uroporphyrinogen decarboxylase family protein [Bacteroidota bacterium]
MEKINPDFNNFLKVFSFQPLEKPVLFEFFLNEDLYSYLAGKDIKAAEDNLEKLKIIIQAFYKADYDYATVPSTYTDTLWFHKDEVNQIESKSLNEGFVISDREGFEKYDWPDPEDGYYDIYNDLDIFLPAGMKLIASGPGGVLENVIELVGFERLCFMIYEDEDLAKDIFDAVGSRLLKFYKLVSSYDPVGALIVNDDWGFKSQTMLSTDMMRKFVFPWHKKMTEAIHSAGKPAILHSCGNLMEVMEDVIEDMKFDGKHSFEDIITPVEEAYNLWGDRIALMGGIDMDFLARSTPEKIRERAEKLLELTKNKGGYALGSGNSIPDYIPWDNYFSMISVVNKTAF